jgi:protein TonB
MFTGISRRPDRIRAGVATVLIHLLLGYALLTGLGVPVTQKIGEVMQVIDLAPPPIPREKIEPNPKRSIKREGRASPPNLKARATEIVLPPPIVPPLVPPPQVVTAKVAGAGAAAASGNAAVVGPGTGSGGIGNGTGSGGAGDGDGDGGDETPPRLRKGRLKNSDYPSSAGEAGVEGTVSVRYLVGVDGRVSECEVTRSSGNAELDRTTCRLIEERFRYDPSRDAQGRPVPSLIVENHSWFIKPEPSPQP